MFFNTQKVWYCEIHYFVLIYIEKGLILMLDRNILEKQAQNAIDWIRDYVEKANAKGVVVRK